MPEELHEAFLRQVRHLRRSIDQYDAGHREVAEVIAATLYTLLQDGGAKAQSSTRLAGVKDRLSFPDSSFRPNSDSYSGRGGPPLCIVGTDGTYWHRDIAFGEPKPTPNYPRLAFNKWWSQTVYINANRQKLSRMNLVCSMRNQDGGGHIDASINNESYHWLKVYGDISIGQSEQGNFTIYFEPELRKRYRQFSISAAIMKGDNYFAVSEDAAPPNARPIEGAHWASMRQIAWEFDRTLIDAGF